MPQLKLGVAGGVVVAKESELSETCQEDSESCGENPGGLRVTVLSALCVNM